MIRSPISWANVKAEVGGSWLGYPPAWLVIAPLWVVISVALTPGAWQFSVAIWLLLANSLGVGAAFGVLLALNATLFSQRQTTPVAVGIVVAAGALLGAIKALSTNALLSWWGIEPALEAAGVLQRVITLAIMGAWLLPTTSIVLSTRAHIEDERDVLVRERIRERFARANSMPRSRENEPIDALVSEFITDVQRQVHQAPDTLTLANQLHDLIESRLRPLSQLMWQQEQRRLPQMNFLHLIRMMFRTHQFATIPTLIGYVVLFIGPQVAYTGIATGLARLTVQLLIITVVCEIGKRLPRTPSAVGVLVYFGVNLILPLLLNEVSTALFGAIPGYSALASYVLLALYFLISSMLFGVFRAAVTHRESIANEIALLAHQQAELRFPADEELFRRNDLAHYLHSHVQNGMLNLALRLSEDRARPVSADEHRLLEELLGDLAQFSSPRTNEHFRAGLVELEQRWHGFIELRLTNELSDTFINSLTPLAIQSTLLVLNEAITNAVRHGQAHHIELRLSELENSLRITCTDDGLGVWSEPQAGLGTALFDSVAGAAWSLTSTAQGTQLQLLLSVGD